MKLRTVGRTAMSATALVFVLGACGGDNSSSSVVTTVTTSATSTTASGNAALCAARDSLKSSIDDVRSVDVIKNGTSALQAALTKVKDNLQAVKAAAGADLQPQVTALQDAVTELGTAITNVASVGVAGVVTATRDVATAGSTLLTSLNNLKCS
jgi:hypothetical protein